MTARQFDAALERNGITRDGALYRGYYDVGDGLNVYAPNAGSRRRDQLAYLLKAQTRHQKQRARAAAKREELATATDGVRDGDPFVGVEDVKDGAGNIAAVLNIRLKGLNTAEAAAVILVLRGAR